MADRESRGLSVLHALFGPVVLFLAVPQGILLSNRHELLIEVNVAAPFYIAFFCVALFALIVAYWSHSAFRRLTIVFSGLALLGLLYSLCRPLAQYLSVSQTLALDATLLVAVVWVTRAVPRPALVRTFAAATCVFMAFVVLNSWTLHLASGAVLYRPARNPATASSEPAGNVYHVVLDGFQRQAFEHLVRRSPELAPADFVFFRQFEAAYSQTQFSLPSVLLGEYYTPSRPLREWAYTSLSARGLFRDLQNGSIGVNVFPVYPYFCPTFAATCDDQITAAGLPNSQSALIDLWFQAILPGTLRALLNQPYHLDDPNYESQPYGFSLTQTIGVRPAAPLYWHAIHSMRGFDRFLKSEPGRPSTRQYHFVHLLLPHAPYLYDARCELYPASTLGEVALGEKEVPAYLDQAECSLQLVRTLVETLKGLDRYESSTIIVHADHGSGLWFPDDPAATEDLADRPVVIPFDRGGTRPEQWPPAVVSSWADALLLVKFPHQQGIMTTFERPVGGLDVAPTVLRSFGLSVDRYQGTPLQDVMKGASPGPVAHFTNAPFEQNFPPTFSEYSLSNGAWAHRQNVDVWGDVGLFFAKREIGRTAEEQTLENVKTVGRQLRTNATRLASSVAAGKVGGPSLAALGITDPLLAEFKKAMGEDLTVMRYSEGFTVDLPTVPRRICEILLTRAHEVPGAVRAGVTSLASMEHRVPITAEQAAADCGGQPEPMFVRIVTRD